MTKQTAEQLRRTAAALRAHITRCTNASKGTKNGKRRTEIAARKRELEHRLAPIAATLARKSK